LNKIKGDRYVVLNGGLDSVERRFIPTGRGIRWPRPRVRRTVVLWLHGDRYYLLVLKAKPKAHLRGSSHPR